MSEDRRVRRTRRNLIDAFTGLVLEKAYERITVQDVLDRADVGRSTFYAHFRDKDALLTACFDGVRDDLRREFAATTPTASGPATVLFEHAFRHRRVYQALCGRRGGGLVHGHLKGLVADAVRDHLGPRPPADGLPVDAVAEFYASATVGLLEWWVDRNFRGGPKAMASLHERLTAPGLRAARRD